MAEKAFCHSRCGRRVRVCAMVLTLAYTLRLPLSACHISFPAHYHPLAFIYYPAQHCSSSDDFICCSIHLQQPTHTEIIYIFVCLWHFVHNDFFVLQYYVPRTSQRKTSFVSTSIVCATPTVWWLVMMIVCVVKELFVPSKATRHKLALPRLACCALWSYYAFPSFPHSREEQCWPVIAPS